MVTPPGENVSAPLVPVKSVPAVAVPDDARQFTVTCSALDPVSATWNAMSRVSLSPSMTGASGPKTASVGAASLSLIVPVAESAVALSVALTALLSVTVNVSAGSSAASSVALTVTLPSVWPARMITVPLVGV